MSKLIKASIDVKKIKKEYLIVGKKGTYVNIDIWINDEDDQYGNIAGIKQSYKVGDDFESHYIGNGKKGFGFDDVQQADVIPAESAPAEQETDSDLPF